MAHPTDRRLRVWDLPTRVFHWLLALAAVALLVTGRTSGRWIDWHALLGYAVAALLLFRIAWGFVGGHWSRFAAFPPSLGAAARYLRGDAVAGPGHNPLGAWSVYAMLFFLGLQVATGLFSQTLEDFAGPLSTLVSNATSRSLTFYHKRIGQWILVALVLMHLAAMAFYAWRGRNLAAAMWSGDAEVDAPAPASRDDGATRLRALAVLAASAGAVWVIVQLGG